MSGLSERIKEFGPSEEDVRLQNQTLGLFTTQTVSFSQQTGLVQLVQFQ